MAWSTHPRRRDLPPDWPARRRAVLHRDPICTLRLRCAGAPSTEVDHTIPRSLGGTHDLTNLAGACSPCHKAKTAAEAAAARKRSGSMARTQPTNRRPNETHPGLLP